MNTKTIPVGLVGALVLTATGLAQSAVAASTTVTQTVNPGLLTLASRPTAIMSPVTVDVARLQTSQGSLGAVEATDSRGSGAGWSLTVTTTGFTKVDDSAKVIAAQNITLKPSSINAMVGSYAGVQAGSEHKFTNESDSATIMTAASGAGEGWYINTPALTLNLPAALRSGDYVATVTETLN